MTGLVTEGRTTIADMLEQTPWPTGKYAEALRRGRAAAGPPEEAGATV